MDIKDIFNKAVEKINGYEKTLTELNELYIVSFREEYGQAILYPRDQSKSIVPNTRIGEGRFAHGGQESVKMYGKLVEMSERLAQLGITDAHPNTKNFEQRNAQHEFDKKVLGFIEIPVDDQHKFNKKLMKKLVARDPENNMYISANDKQR